MDFVNSPRIAPASEGTSARGPLVTETPEFWRNHGVHNDLDPRSIQTQVIRLPVTCFAEEDGALGNSGR